ncbi:MAG TPA: YggS family pyridoxal phosphate-dependent enzyme [Gammaproteobacteria bacterium]|nr:YggS family pyridoxal phosphate-dependent enzyme [Gammaproteobacteria bacterium]
MPEISHHLQQVYHEILLYEQEFGRKPGVVKLVAVSKAQPWSRLFEVRKCGQTLFGESYLQEALEKIDRLRDMGIEWHFIGPVQSNKTRLIAENFDWVHSIDRIKVAQRLSLQRPDNLPPLQVLIQVNTSNETSKSGCSFSAIPELAKQIKSLPGLQLRGLMSIPASSNEFSEQRKPFRKLKATLRELNRSGYELDTLSMGMSRDIRAAIAEGATMVRVGTAIFGGRASKP